eukprot:m.7760 g.7760  ORF g.7760 m.7760 type:complete len:85 (-) comp4889_c0_seq2:800-1054(-)
MFRRRKKQHTKKKETGKKETKKEEEKNTTALCWYSRLISKPAPQRHGHTESVFVKEERMWLRTRLGRRGPSNATKMFRHALPRW